MDPGADARQGGSVARASQGRPIPPINHRACLEIGPSVRGFLEEQSPLARDLEAQEGWGLVESDEIDLAAGRSAELNLQKRARVRG